jgi:hypothetical protein
MVIVQAKTVSATTTLAAIAPAYTSKILTKSETRSHALREVKTRELVIAHSTNMQHSSFMR